MLNYLTIRESPNKKNIESLDLPRKVKSFKALTWKDFNFMLTRFLTFFYSSKQKMSDLKRSIFGLQKCTCFLYLFNFISFNIFFAYDLATAASVTMMTSSYLNIRMLKLRDTFQFNNFVKRGRIVSVCVYVTKCRDKVELFSCCYMDI